jgi:UDP-N-acetyl-D-glucosamine dehydrogenase
VENGLGERLAAIRERLWVVGIVGLGYVGLPLARAFGAAGYRVLGFDTDPKKVESLAAGASYIGHIPNSAVRSMRESGFEATTDFGRLGEPDAVLFCVPTPLSEGREPDLSYVEISARAMASALRPGQLIVLESTTYPGTTREVFKPILEGSGLVAGRDFALAYSPEREDPGNPKFSAPSIPKVVGGIDGASLELAAALYGEVVVEVVRVESLEVSEAAKILENTYRAVNIALVNELKVLFDRMGIDVWSVIEAAKTKPFGFMPFYPGPGLGGHCIPIDPFYLAWVARKHGQATRFIELAGEVNTGMPAYVVSRLEEALRARGRALEGAKVLLLGMAYKRDVDDPRESPGFEILELLLTKGALVRYNDPHIAVLPAMRRYGRIGLASEGLTEGLLQSQDTVVVVTDHSAYDWGFVARYARLVVDTRGATRGLSAELQEKIVRA